MRTAASETAEPAVRLDPRGGDGAGRELRGSGVVGVDATGNERQ
ncbi:hypothetical protein [Frankia gtarii]|nr:hypothetical protein [Frankia gtarii]